MAKADNGGRASSSGRKAGTMSFTKCSGCRAAVLTEADVCPRCGYRMRTSSIRQVLIYLAILGFVLLMFYVAWFLLPQSVA